jgi:hypothetical protein
MPKILNSFYRIFYQSNFVLFLKNLLDIFIMSSFRLYKDAIFDTVDVETQLLVPSAPTANPNQFYIIDNIPYYGLSSGATVPILTTQTVTAGANILITNPSTGVIQISALEGPSADSSQIVYVREGGNDVTGNGTITSPFATITHAMSTITDALWEKRYMIDLGPGNWADNFSWKAWVFIRGSTSIATRLTGTIDINDPSWAIPGSHDDERSGGQDLNFSGTMTLNWTTQPSPYGKFYFWNCNMNNTLVTTGQSPVNQFYAQGGLWFGGINATGTAVTLDGISGQGGTVTLNSSPTQCSLTAFGGGTVGNLILNYTSGTAPTATLIDFPILGT